MLRVPVQGAQNVASTLSRFRRWAKRLVRAETAPERAEITVLTDRVLVIRRRRIGRGWCSQCCSEVDMLSLEEAAVVAGASGPSLRQDLQAQAWHFCDGSDGAPRVCLDSLLKSL